MSSTKQVGDAPEAIGLLGPLAIGPREPLSDVSGALKGDGQTEVIDCLVIGAGPAGLTAGIYLKRFLRSVRLMEDGHSRARWIPRSHNFPGFVGGISGEELLSRLRAQFASFGGQVVHAHVEEIGKDTEGMFSVRTADQLVKARTVLLSTGIVDHVPALDGVEELRSRGLLRQCPICDGYDFRGTHLGVIGTGEHGVREALFLRTFSDNISLMGLPDGDALTPSQFERLQTNQVKCIFGTLAEARPQPDGQVRVRMQDGACHDFDVLYDALGARPRSELGLNLGAQVDEQGRLIVDSHGETSVSGMFAAGDVVVGLDQLAVAAGHAAIAATAIHNRLACRI